MSPWKQAVTGLANETHGGGDTKPQVGRPGMIEHPLLGESLHMANSFCWFSSSRALVRFLLPCTERQFFSVGWTEAWATTLYCTSCCNCAVYYLEHCALLYGQLGPELRLAVAAMGTSLATRVRTHTESHDSFWIFLEKGGSLIQVKLTVFAYPRMSSALDS